MKITTRSGRIAALGLALLMIACTETERNLAGGGVSPPPAATGQPVAGPVEDVVLFVGTSLTAGYGLPVEQSFPMLIQRKLVEYDLPFRAVNAGVSGETSAGALRRVDWLLQQPFAVLVLETGANDMLRGADPETTEANIQAIIDRVRKRHPDAEIVLAGMLALPNLGREYVDRFAEIYPRLAERNGIPLIPFLLDRVAAERDLNLADGIHPNPAGHRIVAENVWKVLEPRLQGRLATPR